MSLDRVLVTALESIGGLDQNVFPLEGLKQAKPPFVLYVKGPESEQQSLGGPTGLWETSYELHCVAQTYAELVWLSGAVKARARALQGRAQEGLFVEYVDIRQTSPDLKETEVDLYRRVFALQVNYQKE